MDNSEIQEAVTLSVGKVLGRIGFTNELIADCLVVDKYIDASVEAIFKVHFWERPLDKQETTVKWTIPATWFQRLKEEHFPEWILDIYPVKYITLRSTVKFKPIAMYGKPLKEIRDLHIEGLGVPAIYCEVEKLTDEPR